MPELFWLQIVCGIVVYTATKIEEPDMNSFYRAFGTVTIGLYAGFGFWQTFQILVGNSDFSLFTTWDYVSYLASMFAIIYVVLSFASIIHRLIRPRAK
jgi:hypothetical protein